MLRELPKSLVFTFAFAVLFSAIASPCLAQEIVDAWRYTLTEPAEGWQEIGFDDEGWRKGAGGFGSRGTPGARIGTNWRSNNIWLRKPFKLDAVPKKPVLLMHHDEDASVFINGKLMTKAEGFTSGYMTFELDETAASALKAGGNTMAVHCRQTSGGQFIDVHLVDADNVPSLARPKRNPAPFQSDLITKWGEEVTAENAWTEYPRPQLKRRQWQNLNGHWDYAITSDKQTMTPEKWTGKILVPFCLESKLSGVKRLLEDDEALWYRRTFLTTTSKNQRQLLNFEAVDYRCEAFVNGESVGTHQGGNTPFSFDVTDRLTDGENELIVRVEDDTEEWQLRGKQILNPHGIWYTQVSGIWQTVWLERVSSSYIKDLKITTEASTGTITIRPIIQGEGKVRVAVRDGSETVAEGIVAGESIELKIADARLWSPSTPHLYGIEATLIDADDNRVDSVSSYAGIRTVGKVRDDDGHWRFTLNGQPIFHWGPLDQGWWPDGLLSPPSDEAMLFDIEWLKRAGFNMIRKHIKVEPRRYYYHCDRLGMMVWQDQVSAGHTPPWTMLKKDPQDAQWPEAHHVQFMLELERMINLLESHPSIVVWVPFNEAWGQHSTVEVGKWTVARDPSRLVNIASGGNFWPVGDMVDAHSYPHPKFPFDHERFKDYIKVMGEFGGHGYPVKGHLWDANARNWGYGDIPKTKGEYRARYVASLERLRALKAKGVAAAVYTQTTDVEGEINGLITYDRKVIKIPAKELAELSKSLLRDGDKID